jgi:uncharacterized protein YidB (DUF937 family)
MGLLDGLLGSVAGGQGQNPQAALLNAVVGMMSGGGAQQGAGGLGGMLSGMVGGAGQQAGGAAGGLSALGGLGGLMGMLQQNGLAEQAASWVGKGENMPVSADQITQALGGANGGNDILGQLAQQAGMSREDTAGGLSQMLPDVVDKLTPNGALPTGGIGNAMEMLSGLMKR